MSSHLGKNVVIVLALVSAGFFAAYLRFRPHLGQDDRWSDGAKLVDDAWTDRIRHAIWDTAFALPGDVNTAEAESKPAWSHDGRVLVFTSGKPGLNRELYVAELVDGKPARVTVLATVNSGQDDVAPAFSDDALWFASNRPGGAGGFDLYRAPYRDGVFDTPVAVGGALATTADETDPAPMPDGSLVFAANRPRDRGSKDFDLFLAQRDPNATGAAGDWLVARFAALSSPLDEREPATTADGRVLYFASNRAGNFDLYRSGVDRGTFLPPTRVDELSTAQDERGPAPSADGFTLAFERPGVSALPGDTDIVAARSLELFRLPGPPVGWLELIVLLSLLAVALLAWLARRWEALDLIYKCFLFALIVHLLLLWWFQRVAVESQPMPAYASGRGSAPIKVRIASAKTRTGALERGGVLDSARAARSDATRLEAVAVDIAGNAKPTESTLARQSHSDAVEAPSRLDAEVERSLAAADSATNAPQLSDRAAPHELLRGDAPSLAMHSPTSDARPAASTSSSVPSEAKSAREAADPSTLSAATRSARVDRGRGPVVADDAPTRSELASAPTHSSALPSPALSDAESVVPFSGGSDVAAESSLVDPATATSFTTAERTGVGSATGEPTATSTDLVALPSSAAFVAAARPSAPTNDAAPAARTIADVGPTRPSSSQAVDFADDAIVPPGAQIAAGAETRELELVAADTSLQRSTTRADAPVGATLALDMPAPAARSATPLVAATAPEVAPAPKPPERLDHTPYRNRFGLAKEQALKEHGGGVETEHAVEAGLAYLAERQNPEGFWGNVEDYQDKYGYVAVGKSGLCLLAFLGKGHTPTSNTEHSEVAARAVNFLLEVQDADTGHFGWTSAYSHGIATYALAECYALTKMDSLKRPLERAVAHILANQNQSRDPKRGGGWGYYNPQGPHFDNWSRVSITSWQVMALESARLSGIEVPDAAFDAAKAFIANAYDQRRGCYRYSHDPSRLNSEYAVLPGSTPAALFAMSLLGDDIAGASFAKARAFVTSRAPTQYRRYSESEFVHDAAGNLYFWYYGALAMFRAGGADWDTWNAAMKNTLLPAQQKNGSWAIIDTYAADIAHDTEGDRCYTTAMCILSLEVYYRYFTPLLTVK